MDCTALNTVAEILEAFRTCSNPGEQIELFECLATRPPAPPIDAFVQILDKIHLEPVKALAIEAFSQIADADIKQRLKQIDDLLTMLSHQAQSGSTDLIRWAAAMAIETVGFDFIAVAQHLTEEPRPIAEKIVQSKVKKFADKNLLQDNDYDKFVNFWAYGALEKLKEISLNCQLTDGSPLYETCQRVMESLSLKGIEKVNTALQRAESMGDKAFPIDENELFEAIAQRLAKEKLEGKVNPNQVNILIKNQLHCLQSNNSLTKKSAAQVILQLGTTFFEKLQQSQPTLALAASIFSQDWYQPTRNLDFYFLLDSNQLEPVARQFEILANKLTRKQNKQDCQEWMNLLLAEKLRREAEIRFEILRAAQTWQCVHTCTINLPAAYTRLIISPDGQTLFSFHNDNFNYTIQIWKVSTGQQIRTLTGHSGYVQCLVISPDGQTLFSGSDDKTIKIWKVSTGQEIRTLTGHSGRVEQLAISPDGQTLFSNALGDDIKIWKVSAGQEIRPIAGAYGRLAISPDGQTLFTSGRGNIQIWQVSTGQKIRTLTLTGHSRVAYCLTVSPDGQTLFSSEPQTIFKGRYSDPDDPPDKTLIKIWQVSTGQEIRTLPNDYSTVICLAISPDGQTLFSGSLGTTIKLWQVSTGKEIRTLIGHSALVKYLAISPDGQTLFSFSNDKTIKIWRRD